GDVAGVFEREGDGVERLHHAAGPEEAEVAAAPAGGDVVGVEPGQRGEVLACREAVLDLPDRLQGGGGVGLGLALEADEDVAGADVGRARAAVLDVEEVVPEAG